MGKRTENRSHAVEQPWVAGMRLRELGAEAEDSVGASSDSVVSQTQLHCVVLPWVAFTSRGSDFRSTAWGLCHLIFEIPTDWSFIIHINIWSIMYMYIGSFYHRDTKHCQEMS